PHDANPDDERVNLKDRVFNPALVKPLMKVWVWKRSKDLLPDLYRPEYEDLVDYIARHQGASGVDLQHHHLRLWRSSLLRRMANPRRSIKKKKPTERTPALSDQGGEEEEEPPELENFAAPTEDTLDAMAEEGILEISPPPPTWGDDSRYDNRDEGNY